jgi:hypothetical protein
MNKTPVERSHVPDPIQLSTSHWFEFETEVLSQEESLDGLRRINRDLLEQIAAMGSPQRVLLEIDGQTPVCGEQEDGSCNTRTPTRPTITRSYRSTLRATVRQRSSGPKTPPLRRTVVKHFYQKSSTNRRGAGKR